MAIFSVSECDTDIELEWAANSGTHSGIGWQTFVTFFVPPHRGVRACIFAVQQNGSCSVTIKFKGEEDLLDDLDWQVNSATQSGWRENSYHYQR